VLDGRAKLAAIAEAEISASRRLSRRPVAEMRDIEELRERFQKAARQTHDRHSVAALSVDLGASSLCQRRSKIRPMGGVKVGHLALQAGNVGRA